MKSLFKFTLLFALIISGKLAKQTSTVAVAKTIQPIAMPDTSVVFVHQVTSAANEKVSNDKPQPQPGGIGLIANMF